MSINFYALLESPSCANLADSAVGPIPVLFFIGFLEGKLKYFNWAAFAQHLQGVAPASPGTYLVISPCRFERKKICAQILSAFRLPEFSLERGGDDVSIAEVIEELSSQSFLQAQRAVFVDESDKLKKKEKETLLTLLPYRTPGSLLVLGAVSPKPLDEIYNILKKEMIVFDLSGEKPWDKRRRLERFAIELSAKKGKLLSLANAQILLDRLDLSLPLLEQEVEKLSLFCMDEKEIPTSAILSLSPVQAEFNGWAAAEGLVWDGKIPSLDDSFSLGDFLTLIGQIRYQLEMGLQIASCTQPVATLFPQIKPALLERKSSLAKKLRYPYFRNALAVLFDVELLAKNSSVAPQTLLDLLFFKTLSLRTP